jgi:hypothetical protein
MFDGFSPGRRLADDFDLGVGGEQLDKASAHQVVIVSDEHTRHLR